MTEAPSPQRIAEGQSKGRVSKEPRPRRYDLEERTFEFARSIRSFVRVLPRTTANREDVVQLVRSSGSVGANYIEANEALGRKDFVMRIRICRKEVKETGFWLKLLNVGTDPNLETVRSGLVQESDELASIFGAIITKTVRSSGL